MSLRGLYRALRKLFVDHRARTTSVETSPAEMLTGARGNWAPYGLGAARYEGHPSDREVWQRLAEPETPQLQEWADSVQANLPRLPDPCVLYNLQEGLYGGQPSDEVFWELVDDLHRETLRALQRAAGPDEWLYAIDHPEVSYFRCYRFWPQRASATRRWYVSPVPDGDDQFFVSRDFQWGILSLFWGMDWRVCVFGQPLLDAFVDAQPRAFSHRLSDLR